MEGLYVLQQQGNQLQPEPTKLFRLSHESNFFVIGIGIAAAMAGNFAGGGSPERRD
ncbi:unnamed protein product [Linum tenue]|uniref:Uncharacterized protein n=1 Tax=Linum tenue TaxID=586396 RepID=A0AAV0JFF8_9ROSI|nr:unnamed protein product [Linum tenue]